MAIQRRALHYVLKIGNLKQNLEFFRDKLGMTVLRHEVFDKGCDAACNGPYDGKWSKTMIGYGPEDDHFVLELTYNYSIGGYRLGNDLQYLKIGLNHELFQKLMTSEAAVGNSTLPMKSPDGYQLYICKNSPQVTKQDVTEVCLATRDLSQSSDYWVKLLAMNKVEDFPDRKELVLNYDTSQARLRLKEIDEDVDHKSAFGRIAFSCPADELKPIQKAAEDAGQKVLTPYLSLDTPGKATVQVVILADPDGHEICFVGDEGFKELSQVDPEANALIEKSVEEDKSQEWYEKKSKSKRVG